MTGGARGDAFTPNRDAVIEWGVKQTLRGYMSRSDDFEIEVSGGATFTLEEGVRMPGRTDADGVLHADGSVVLRAHGGALAVPLVGVQVTADTLSVEDPGAEPEEEHARLTLVQLDEAPAEDASTRTFGTRLAAQADGLFMYNYLPNSSFDPLTVRFSAS